MIFVLGVCIIKNYYFTFWDETNILEIFVVGLNLKKCLIDFFLFWLNLRENLFTFKNIVEGGPWPQFLFVGQLGYTRNLTFLGHLEVPEHFVWVGR